MDIRRFFEHWQIELDPFAAEEAGKDRVFAQLGTRAVAHKNFEKILGDIQRPSTSIICGQKGSGKSTIRLQIAHAIQEHNLNAEEQRCMLVNYDDLNPVLQAIWDQLRQRAAERSRGLFKRKVEEPSQDDLFFSDDDGIELVDHFDAILHLAVSQLVDAMIDKNSDARGPGTIGLTRGDRKRLQRAHKQEKLDLMLLQALYDRDDPVGNRAGMFARAIRLPGRLTHPLRRMGGAFNFGRYGNAAPIAAGQLRALGRRPSSIRDSLSWLPLREHEPVLHLSQAPLEERYRMMQRLQQALRVLGVGSMIVIIDQVDEPSFVQGDDRKMWAIIKPMLRLKFLNQKGVGIKMLLPLELRKYILGDRERYQEARLDKMNFIERFTWTGAMLYDVCNARLQAARAENAAAISLEDLFDERTQRAELVDGLDAMQTPRDAFKLLYECIQRHCDQIVTEQQKSADGVATEGEQLAASGDDGADDPWHISRDTFMTVATRQQRRVEELHEGLAPA